ncbi:MAG: DUF2484 family protein [Proteobacteria bacterium]|nr:DUF2484 family protein [Pseudomonadota bacterium]MDA1285765.1 DUF2484 family protein [Pseudomonadota bacterium]
MNVSLLVTIAWILVVSFVGMLPRDYHKRFGFPMLILFPFVLGYLAWDMGLYWALALLAAALSIFRYPAKYYGLALWRKLTGRPAVE